MTPIPKKRRKRVDPSKTGTGQIAKTIYFYSDEHELVKSAADAQGISVSAFVTKAAIEAASRLQKK
jgi:uncharacterized protein (DUF1778 family)